MHICTHILADNNAVNIRTTHSSYALSMHPVPHDVNLHIKHASLFPSKHLLSMCKECRADVNQRQTDFELWESRSVSLMVAFLFRAAAAALPRCLGMSNPFLRRKIKRRCDITLLDSSEPSGSRKNIILQNSCWIGSQSGVELLLCHFLESC